MWLTSNRGAQTYASQFTKGIQIKIRQNLKKLMTDVLSGYWFLRLNDKNIINRCHFNAKRNSIGGPYVETSNGKKFHVGRGRKEILETWVNDPCQVFDCTFRNQKK